MHLTVIGCSGSVPGPESPASAYLAEADGFRLLIDLGSGALGGLQRMVPLDGVDAICLSHLHGDHCLDVCGYEVARTIHPDGPLGPIPVYGPEGTADRLNRASRFSPAHRAAAGHGIAGSFDFSVLRPGWREIGPFAVRTEHMNHPVETFGFRLEHGGRAVAYSADTGESEDLVALARGADVLLCEATFTDRENVPPGQHLTARGAAEHATRAGVGRLVLTHIPPWGSAEAARAQAAASYDGPVELAVTGLRI